MSKFGAELILQKAETRNRIVGKAQLVRVRDFRVQEEFSRAQIPASRIAPSPQGGIWIGTHKGELGLFRNGALQMFPVNPDPKSPLANQIIVEADGSVLAAFDDGLVGLRHGREQRLTTKNGLPCDEVMSFIQDKEKRWWLNTQCGIVELSDSELERWWANPETIVQNRVYEVLDGARPSARPPFNSAATSPDGAPLVARRRRVTTGHIYSSQDRCVGGPVAGIGPFASG